MAPPSSFSKQSFALLHSMMVAVIFGFFLEPNIVGAHFQMSFWKSPLGILTAAFFVFLRVIFFSGMYASMLEIASGEKDLLTLKQIWKNANRYWFLYSLLALVPVAVHFVFFALMRHIDIPILFVGILFDGIVLYAF
ncbi:MAG TPA: hypothetical protein P5160_01505, partial [Candidatus Omnitrophota bacterium]|nr:hypothetical protein [Candidatus Omnitrophota bacterium]